MVTWSSTALVLLQSKYSFALAHAAPLSLSLSFLHSTAHAEFQVNQIDSSAKSSPWSLECGWSKLTDGFGSLSLIVISSFRSYHTLESLSLSLSHSHTLESFSYICEMKNRFQLPRNLQLRNADGRTKDSYKCSYSCRYRYTDTDTDTPLVIVVEKDTTAIADKYLLWSLRHLRKLLSVFILSTIYFNDFFFAFVSLQ